MKKEWKDKCDCCGQWKSCIGCKGKVLCAECVAACEEPKPVIHQVKHKSDPELPENCEQLALF